MISAEVGPPSSIVAAWITHLAGSSPALVADRLAEADRSERSLSVWIARPPALTIAPATPPPCRSSVLAALAIASTSSLVMSACWTSISATGRESSAPASGAGRIAPRGVALGMAIAARQVETLAADSARTPGRATAHGGDRRTAAGAPLEAAVGRVVERAALLSSRVGSSSGS